MILKTIKITNRPKEGEVKQTTHFAWLPTKTDQHIIWLHRYIKTYKWVNKPTVVLYFPFFLPVFGVWELQSTLVK